MRNKMRDNTKFSYWNSLSLLLHKIFDKILIPSYTFLGGVMLYGAGERLLKIFNHNGDWTINLIWVVLNLFFFGMYAKWTYKAVKDAQRGRRSHAEWLKKNAKS